MGHVWWRITNLIFSSITSIKPCWIYCGKWWFILFALEMTQHETATFLRPSILPRFVFIASKRNDNLDKDKCYITSFHLLY